MSDWNEAHGLIGGPSRTKERFEGGKDRGVMPASIDPETPDATVDGFAATVGKRNEGSDFLN